MYWMIKDTQGSTHHLNQLVMLHVYKKILRFKFVINPEPQSLSLLEYLDLEYLLHLSYTAFIAKYFLSLFYSIFLNSFLK